MRPRALPAAAGIITIFRLVRRFTAAAAGNVAIITTIALPVVALAAVGGVQIAAVENIRAKTQEIADSAAIAGAEQITISYTGASTRAQTWAQGQLANLLGSSSTTYQATATAVDATHIQMTITTSTPSYFGSSLPVGGFQTSVTATAESVSQWPLCLLVTAPHWVTGGQLTVNGASSIYSNCQIYSDSNLYIAGGARIRAASTQVVGTVTGAPSNIGPATPMSGAQSIADPFTPLQYLGPQGTGMGVSPCMVAGVDTLTGSVTLPPGHYCANVIVTANATVALTAGEYQFDALLEVQPGGVVSGDNVLLFFAPGSSLDLQAGSSIAVGGRQTGPHAGFVLTTTHRPSDLVRYPLFKISSDPLSKITGILYSPIEPIEFQGGSTAGGASDWTVIVASSVTLSPQGGGSPTLQLNTNYAGSVVPVPTGVGNTVAATRLVN